MQNFRWASFFSVVIVTFLQLAAFAYAPNAAADAVYTTYSFSQSGWSNATTHNSVGGTLSISFDGIDYDNNGNVIGGSAIGGNGVSSFTLTWSGNNELPAFSSLFNIVDPAYSSNLTALLYVISENDFNGGQSIIFSPHLEAGRDFSCEPGVIICGNLMSANGMTLTTTRAPTPVPEPTSLALLALAGIGLVVARRHQSRL